MPDLDDLLRSDIAGAASRSVQPPEFAAVAARGRRLRHHRRVATTAALVLVVLAGGGVALGRDALGTTPRPADPQPTPHRLHRTPAPDRGPTPQQVVDDPAASVTEVAVAAENPDVRAVLWQVCVRRCHARHAAIALTDDGFATRTLVAVRNGVYPYLHAAGPHAFLVTNVGRHPYLLGTDGAKRALATPGPAAPVRDGEVLTRWRGSGDDFVAVDPDKGAVHQVPVPAGTTEAQADGPGRLEALVASRAGRSPRLAWSDDGGATWRDHLLVSGDRSIYQLVPSAATGFSAVLVGSDGATFFPFDGVVQGTRDGASWRSFAEERSPTAYVDGAAVGPDGRLYTALPAFSDARPGHPGRHRPGVYVSDAEDWSKLTRVEPSLPDSPALDAAGVARLRDADLSVAGTALDQGHLTLYVIEDQQSGGSNRLYAVDNGGRTWTPLRVR